MMFRRHSIATMLSLRVPLRGRILAFASSSSSCTISSSREETILIKPSSPTPRHLAEFKLSLVDNHMSPVYLPLVFFYNINPAPSCRSINGELIKRLDILKSSLAQALTRFYPLAGRLSKSADDRSTPIVLCNDEGVPFSTSTIADDGGTLESFLSKGPAMEALQEFLPFPASVIGTPADIVESAPQIAIRATVFSCGGLAIGVCVLHKIIDGHTAADFMKLWAAVARGSEQGGCGSCAHDRAATSLFPARHDDVIPSAVGSVSEEGKSVTKRFVFSEEAISELKVRARSERVRNPTRSEVISGLLWNSAVNAAAAASSPDGVNPGSVYSVAVMPVDLRSRLKEPWADYSVGNILWGAVALYENGGCSKLHSSYETTKALQQLVYKLRASIAKVDKKFVEKLEGGTGREEHRRYNEMLWKIMAGAPNGSKPMCFAVSSAIRIGLYDVDFGWGKPIWISMAKLPDQATNFVILLDSTTAGGVEAWVVLPEQEMNILEHDPELLGYAKNNPNIL